MGVESADDRAVFFETEGFGVAVTINAVTFNAIKDQAFQEIDLGSAGMAGTRPLFLARDEDIVASSAAVDDTVTIASVNYTIVELEPDGTGMTNVILDKQ